VVLLFTSGYPDGEISRRGLLVPGVAFIQKPFSPEAIVKTVRDLLQANRHPKPQVVRQP
jgi:two-component system cell cycle sensor histidine kinase/response regulator CckA